MIETGAVAPDVEARRTALTNRHDMVQLALALCRPMIARLSPGRARVRLGAPAALYPLASQEMEGFCRLLWGVAPLLLDEGFPWRDELLTGLLHGTDPRHPEFWGVAGDYDQRLVECAAIAYAILMKREWLLGVASNREIATVASFLGRVNAVQVRDNNWLWFRVLINAALERLDAPHVDRRADFDRIDAFYRGRGWYSDAVADQFDYYCAFGFHFYGLLYATLVPDDPRRAECFKERAAAFAEDFVYWFGGDGAAVPYGRSLTYRFGQGAFWGALALAGVGTFTPGVTKGLLLRHLRWWLRQPIFSEAGLLTVGYAYETRALAESYTSPASPYWALKAFVALAMPETDAFWTSDEQALPACAPARALRNPRMLVCRSGDHVVALAGGQSPVSRHRHFAEKYAKFCYSNQFGFSVPVGARGLSAGAHDSMLALSDGDEYFRVRDCSVDVEVDAHAVISTWRPWRDVEITTWLIPAASWHVRVHRIRTERSLLGAEGGFALPLDDVQWTMEQPLDERGVAAAVATGGTSVIWNLCGERDHDLIRADPNTNLMRPRTVIPTLLGFHASGEHWLACGVMATRERLDRDGIAAVRPGVTLTTGGFMVSTPQRGCVYSWHQPASRPMT